MNGQTQHNDLTKRQEDKDKHRQIERERRHEWIKTTSSKESEIERERK